MSRRDEQRLEDILAATASIGDHLHRGNLDDGMVFDAVRVRLIEIGEATIDRDLPPLAAAVVRLLEHQGATGET